MGEADIVVAEARATASAYGGSQVHAHADRLEGRASLATRNVKGGLTLLSSARRRFVSLGDRWGAARSNLGIAAAGGTVDLDALHQFFTDLGGDEESEQSRLLGDAPGAR